MNADDFTPMIGLEIHAQLLTESKMFCGCSARYSGMPPNSHVCAVDLGLPGALPVINRKAVDLALMVALALHCEIAELTRFDRKNYPYPDIPKGYQISQYDTPLGRNGYVELDGPNGIERVGIIRAHLEEDTGKTIHGATDGREVSLVDYNRSGIPLLEIVSEADMTTPDAARRYFAGLRETLVYLGVCSGDLQEGAMRADVNVSVRRESEPPGTKIEIKNLNSFRAVERALRYEIDRQIEALLRGEPLFQETRGWDETKEVTVSQRSKEHAEDYRYFPEPDLPPLNLTQDHIEAVRAVMPETAGQKRERYTARLGLSEYDAEVLTQNRAVAQLFDQTVALVATAEAKAVANWLTGEYRRLLGERVVAPAQARVTGEALAELIHMLRDGTITMPVAKTVFEDTFDSGDTPSAIVDRRGLRQVSDRSELAAAVRRVIEENPTLVEEYVNKDRKTEGPLVGRVMAATGGKASPIAVKELLAELIAAR